MGGRAGGGARSGGGGAARSISGIDKYNQKQTFTLEQHMSEYKRLYAKADAERGETYRKQAAAATTEQLKGLVKGPTGEAKVKADWNEKVKLIKSGGYDINLANPKEMNAGMYHLAVGGLIHNIAKQELARRRRK